MQNATLALHELDAVIFDLNGTMINDGLYHRQAFKIFFEKYGLNLSEEEYRQKIHARRNSEIFPALFNEKLSPEKIAALSWEKEQTYRDLYAPLIQEVAGLSNLIRKLQQAGLVLALASSSPPENIQLALERLGLTNAFTSIINGFQVSQSKPNPEIYLKTLAALQVPAKRCLAFEDSEAGVAAAHAAGLRVIGILTEQSEQELLAAGAEAAIKTFEELTVAA